MTVITPNWLFDSADAGYTLPEANYNVKKKAEDLTGNGRDGVKASTSTPSSSRAEGIVVSILLSLYR